MNSDLRPVSTASSRRAVLAGAGSIGVLTVLAACAANGTGGDGSGEGGLTPDGSGATIPAPGDGGSQSGTVPEPDATTPTGPVDLGKTTSIPVGGGIIFGAQSVVVTQPSKGTFRAFSSTCTHQGCTVGAVAGGLILCPCHGSEYSIVDGSVRAGPAPLPLPRKAITITNGNIFLKT